LLEHGKLLAPLLFFNRGTNPFYQQHAHETEATLEGSVTGLTRSSITFQNTNSKKKYIPEYM
jgi:hypothetical protein